MSDIQPNIRPQQGFTLLEALIALVVISIGLLGVLGLQSFALVSTKVSESKTVASFAADNLADRIRANHAGMRDGSYNSISESDGNSRPTADCTSGSCSTAEMAAWDIYEWKTMVSNALGGEAKASCITPGSPTAANPCRAFEIAVSWKGREAPDPNGATPIGDNCDEFDEPCFVTVFRP